MPLHPLTCGCSAGSFLVDKPTRDLVLETVRDAQEWGAATMAEAEASQGTPRRRISWSALRGLSDSSSAGERPWRRGMTAVWRPIRRLWTPHGQAGMREKKRLAAAPSMMDHEEEEEAEVEEDDED